MRFLLFVITCTVGLGCRANNYTQRGAQVGGLGGAGIGAVIGEAAADAPLAGAAIGSAVGALTGASIGDGLDEVSAAQRSGVQQAAYQQHSGVALGEVVEMSAAGLSDDIITRHIRNEGFLGSLDAVDLIALRRQGVSDRVIATLQELADRPVMQVSAVEPVAPPPVIVEHHYEAVPIFRPRVRGYGRRPLPRHRPGLHWGVTFSN